MPLKEREGYKSEQIRNEAFALVNLNKRQEQVLQVIRDWQPISNEAIAKHLNCFPHEVTPRTKELRDLGYVIFAGTTKGLSGRKASLWMINPDGKQLDMFN